MADPHPTSSAPRATYRFQFHRGFTLRDALNLVPYLDELGVSHIYASPLLKAVPGSTHGYDCCDPSRINPEIGTESDLEQLAEALHARGMGLVLDIVPNHAGIGSPENRWWWDVLQHGRASAYADFFDINWESPDIRWRGKVLLPVLGDHYGRVLERGELKLSQDIEDAVLCYFDLRFPLAPRTFDGPPETMAETISRLNRDRAALDELIQRQHYWLTYWRHGDVAVNYRRFFNITSLAGLRVEEPKVFDAVHATVLRWHNRALVDGLRVDHPDGLRRPAEYFQRLRAAAPAAWIVAEKILQADEQLPDDWPVAGTTGYDFMCRLAGLFIDPASEQSLTECYRAFAGEPTDYQMVVQAKQRLVLRELLASEVSQLTGLLQRAAARYARFRDLLEPELREPLIEVITRLPVYRTYAQPEAGVLSDADKARLVETLSQARQARPELEADAFEFLEQLLLLQLRGETESEFVARFQQLTGPAMAKGAEDTACYCYNRLIALNMVGGDPGRLGERLEDFHAACRTTQQRWPQTMLATSSHDTKRAEDVRARISLLSEIPEDWHAAVHRWSAMNEQHRHGHWPDRNIEYFYYQTLVGAWPLPVERALSVMQKVSYESKQHTRWTRHNQRYDAALRDFIKGTLNDREFTADLELFVSKLIEPGYVASLAQTLVKLTAPGVPDIYQGNELWDLSLVDPDNRRPVDFDLRGRRLRGLKDSSIEQVWSRLGEGLPKLWLIQKVLRFRRAHESWFCEQAGYEPLTAHGAKSNHAVVFSRSGKVITLVPRLVLGLAGGWDDTVLHLPSGNWRNEFTGEIVSGECCVGELLRRFPVALFSSYG